MGYVQGVLKGLALNVPKGQVGTLKRVRTISPLTTRGVKVVSEEQ